MMKYAIWALAVLTMLTKPAWAVNRCENLFLADEQLVTAAANLANFRQTFILMDDTNQKKLRLAEFESFFKNFILKVGSEEKAVELLSQAQRRLAPQVQKRNQQKRLTEMERFKKQKSEERMAGQWAQVTRLENYHTGEIVKSMVNGDESRWVTLNKLGQIHVFDLNRLTPVDSAIPPVSMGWYNPAGFHDNRLAAVRGNQIRLINIQDQSEVALPEESSPYTSVAFTPDGKQVVGILDTGEVKIYDLNTMQPVSHVPRQLSEPFTKTQFSPDGSFLYTLGRARFCGINLKTMTALTIPYIMGGVDTLSFIPNSSFVIIGSSLGRMLLVDFKHVDQARVLYQHTTELESSEVSSDGTWLLSRDQSGEMRIFNLVTETKMALSAEDSKNITACQFTRDGRSVISANSQGEVKILDLVSQQTEFSVPTNLGAITSITQTSDPSKIFFTTKQGELGIWFQNVDEAIKFKISSKTP